MNRTMRRLDAAAQDLRFAARQLRRRPAFTAIALLVIAAGIGVNAATLSFLSAVYARTLPVPEAGRLVAIHGVDARTARAVRLEPAHVAHVRAHASGFSGLAAQDWAWTWLSEGDRSVEWRCGLVSEEYFDLLRVTPFLGRFFAEGDDESALVLSHAAWIQTFDGDPHVLGRGLRLNQRFVTVIGVAPRGFGGVHVGDGLDAWMVSMEPSGTMVGRLVPGRSHRLRPAARRRASAWSRCVASSPSFARASSSSPPCSPA